MARIKRRVFTSDWKNQPVMIPQDDYERLCAIIDSLCRISNLFEIHEMKEILFHVSMENYKEDLKQGLKEMHEIFG